MLRLKNPFHFLLLTIFIDATGAGLLIPIMPVLVQELAGVGISEAAVYGGMMMALFSAVQFVSAPILGSISDAIGRRPVLIVSLIAFAMTYLLMGMAPSIEWLFVGQAFVGLFGATHAAAGAYVADVTRPERRARSFGLIGAAFGVGFMAGPVISGFLAEFGTRAPFYAAAAIALINAAYGYFILPESLQPENRRAFRFKSSNPIGLLKRFRHERTILTLLLAAFLAHFSLQSVPTTWPYFTGFVLGWGPREVGISLGVYGLVNVLAQGFLLGLLTRVLRDQQLAMFGLGLALLASVGFVFADSEWMIFALCVPSSMSFMAIGALSSCVSRSVPANEQGAAQGALAGMQNASAIFSPLVMPWMFQYFSSGSAGVVFAAPQFVLAAILALMSLRLVARIKMNH